MEFVWGGWKFLFENAAITMYNGKYVGLCSEVHVSHRGILLQASPHHVGKTPLESWTIAAGSLELYY